MKQMHLCFIYLRCIRNLIMSNYQTVICIGDTSIYKVLEVKEFLNDSLLASGGFFAARYDQILAASFLTKVNNSNCENSKFLLKTLEKAGKFIIYSEKIADKLSSKSFNALLEHEKAHLEFKDYNLDPETYRKNIDDIELKADKKAASVVGKETMKEALLEILNILVQNLMDNKPNGRSFEYNYNNIVNASHFKKRFEALS